MGLAIVGKLAAAIFDYRWLASILLLAAIDLATLLAFAPAAGPQVFDQQDKVLHAAGFCGLYVMGHLSLQFDWFPRVRPPAYGLHLLNALFWLGYGFFIEAVQQFLPSRSASLHDVLADVAGILCGALCVHLFWLYPRPRSERS